MELFEELKWRGLVDNVTSEEVEDVINNGKLHSILVQIQRQIACTLGIIHLY